MKKKYFKTIAEAEAVGFTVYTGIYPYRVMDKHYLKTEHECCTKSEDLLLELVKQVNELKSRLERHNL